MTGYALWIATVILLIFTLVPLWRHNVWWVRILDFPRLQLAVISLLLIIGSIIFLDLLLISTWIIIAISICCLIYHAVWIIPYTKIFPVEVKSSRTQNKKQAFSIMTANVLTSNHNSDELLNIIRKNDPDILVTLESDSWWQSKLDTLEPDYPYTIKCALDNLYGMHVYSKFQLINSQIEYLVQPDIPSMHTLVRLPSGENIRMHFLHPKPPVPTENEASSERDAELVIIAKSVAEADGPVIVTGDLNDVAWSETTRLFRKISGLLDPRVGRGMFNTYHAGHWFIRWPLDHLFHSTHFTLASLKRLGKYGSDHFALLTRLVYEPEQQNNQEGLNADPEDISWATEKASVENVRVKDVPEPENR